MNAIIVYASHHGHTRRICERITDGLRERGVPSEMANVEALPEDFSLEPFDAAIVAGPVHYGRHPRALASFVQAHRRELEERPAAWISVSLAASDPKGASEARDVARTFAERTGWHPAVTMPVAGALSYRRYNPLLRLVMRHIARVSGAATDTSRDHVYTDWDQVDAFTARMGESLGSGAYGATTWHDEGPIIPP